MTPRDCPSCWPHSRLMKFSGIVPGKVVEWPGTVRPAALWIALFIRAYSHRAKSNNIKEKHRRKLSLSFPLSLGVNGAQIKSYIAASNEYVRSFNRLHSSSSRVLRKINFLNESCDNLILVSLPYLCSMSPTLSIYHIIWSKYRPRSDVMDSKMGSAQLHVTLKRSKVPLTKTV